MSKLALAGTVLIGSMGGLYYGPSFYSNSNLSGLALCGGVSLVGYIINRTYYIQTYKKIDENLSYELAVESDKLLEEDAYQPPSNPDYEDYATTDAV